MPASKRFLQVYDALPTDAQELLVQKHLVPLLDIVSKDRRKRAATSATEMQHRYARMPSLNLKAKKAEIAALLLELSRESKHVVIKARARREQLLSEAIESLVHWLNDIWKVVFEFHTHFRLAHACLLFACDAVDQIGNTCAGCMCSYATMFIPVKITRSSGKVVKSFSLVGAHKLEKVLLWIWRDLFITILATDPKRQRCVVPDMIDDIRILLGSRALEQLLHGGSTQDEDEDDRDQHVARDHSHADDWPNIIDDDGDQNYISDDHASICDGLYPRTLYASHWSWRIAGQQPRLRDLIQSALFKIFQVTPSAPLYSSMISIADDQEEMDEKLYPLVMAVAGHSSENFSAALRIMALNSRTDAAANLDTLLNVHSHLLRPQDAGSLQLGVLIMANHFLYRAHAVLIIEEELFDVTRVFRAAIRSCFCNIDSEINAIELTQILALRRDSLNRRNRIERWVKGILTPQTDTPNPMAFAALVMGIPLPLGLEGAGEGDMLGYFELDGDDSEAEDLREEFRPNIKGRFQVWVETALGIKGGSVLLIKAYAKIIVDMPFLRANDIIGEMSKRLSDRPCKAHIADALDAFREFCEKQNAVVVAAKRNADRTAATATTSDTDPSPPGSESTSGSTPNPPDPQPAPLPVFFPVEDVD